MNDIRCGYNDVVNPKITLVQGNTLELTVSLKQRVRTFNGTEWVTTESAYTPSEDEVVTVELRDKKRRRAASYVAEVNGSNATIREEGTLPIGIYEVSVIGRGGTNPWRYAEDVFVEVIKWTADAPDEDEIATGQVVAYDMDVVTYDIFRGNGIESITKTSTVGNVDTYTITFTYGEPTTFTVTNAAGVPAEQMEEIIEQVLAQIDVPDSLADLAGDSTHRTVTDAEKSTWNGKQNALTFDNVPTANSDNPVKSGGVYQAIQSIDVSSQISGKAEKSEMSVVAGTGANADKTTITLKNGTSATVLTQHQDVSKFIMEGEVFGSGGDSAASFNSYADTVWNKQQTLSESQKQQVRENIGIADLETIRSGAAAGATAVQPAAMNTALAAKQDTLTFDNAPTANSNNPVKSSGIKTALDAKQSTISTVNVTVDNNTGTPSGSASVSGSTLSISFQNLKGATGEQGPQGIQGVQGVQGPKGDTGVTGDASSLAIIHGIDKTSSYGTTDVCGADAAQALLNEIEGGFYY